MILKNIYISLGILIEDVLDMGKNEVSLFFFYVFASFKIFFGVLIPREILFRVFFVGKKVKSNSPWQWCVPFCFFLFCFCCCHDRCFRLRNSVFKILKTY